MGFKSRRSVQLIFLGACAIDGQRQDTALDGGVSHWPYRGGILREGFYCGYVFPLNTLTEGIDWLYQKMGIREKRSPGVGQK